MTETAFDNYYYDEQLKRYLIQFMAVFSGKRVRVGWTDDKEPRLITVPIKNASVDRVVGAIKGENTQNKMIRLPLYSAWIQGITPAPEREKGIHTKRRSTFMPTGGLFPDDINVVEQQMPIPYNLTMELGIWASNQDQHYQMVEQILMLFRAGMIQIQTSDEAFDWKKITQIQLTDIRPEENMPMGADRRIIQTTMVFTVPIWISIPVDVHDKFIKDIYIRLGAVSQSAQTSYDIVAELDAQGIEYDLAFSLDNIVIDEE